MAIQSTNPTTGEVIKSFEEISDTELEAKLAKAQQAYLVWKESDLSEREEKMARMAKIYRERAEELGKLASLEMGKTAAQGKGEVEKCAWLMEYYVENARKFLQPQMIETEAQKSYVRFDSLGVILAVMPWNFPYWQAVRGFVPNLMVGNTVVLKHASNVPQVALMLEQLVLEAGFPEGALTTLLIGSGKVESVINDSRVRGATLTGSEFAGSQVAAAAGRNIKPTVLELGGSDPFIVYPDVDIDEVVAQAVVGRTQNNGQSCVASKRFIVHKDIHDEFKQKFKAGLEKLVVGDPMNPETQMGPVVNQAALDELARLIDTAVAAGAELVTGGVEKEKPGFFCKPTLLANIPKTAPIYLEETFGPVASLYSFATDEEMLEIANATEFGLGASIWTRDIAKAEELAANVEAGSVFINRFVASNPALPFGGIKKSGYGRELSEYGLKEFVNIKTVFVK
jgi:succinate-semialdehyde dehydrogenase/glutarate-semialdehyde dehydrogenase